MVRLFILTVHTNYGNRCSFVLLKMGPTPQLFLVAPQKSTLQAKFCNEKQEAQWLLPHRPKEPSTTECLHYFKNTSCGYRARDEWRHTDRQLAQSLPLLSTISQIFWYSNTIIRTFPRAWPRGMKWSPSIVEMVVMGLIKAEHEITWIWVIFSRSEDMRADESCVTRPIESKRS